MSASGNFGRRNKHQANARALLDNWSELIEDSLVRSEVQFPEKGSWIPSWAVWLAACSLTRRTSSEYFDETLLGRLQAAATRVASDSALTRSNRKVECRLTLGNLERTAASRALPLLQAYRFGQDSRSREDRVEAAGQLLRLADLLDLLLLAVCELDCSPESPAVARQLSDSPMSVEVSAGRFASTARWLAYHAADVPELRAWYAAHSVMLSPSARARASAARSAYWTQLERPSISIDEWRTSDLALGHAASAVTTAAACTRADLDEEALDQESRQLARSALRLVSPTLKPDSLMLEEFGASSAIFRLPDVEDRGSVSTSDNEALETEPGVALFAMLARSLRPQLAAAQASSAPAPSPRFRWEAPGEQGFATWTASTRDSDTPIVLRFFDSEGSLSTAWNGKSLNWFGRQLSIAGSEVSVPPKFLCGDLPIVRIMEEAADLQVDGEPWALQPPERRPRSRGRKPS